jgi:UDP-2,3-diacylglucosamine pyrophosphatase LpxH
VSYAGDIAAGLGHAFDASARQRETIELSSARLIIFSDHHRGAGGSDGADDFRRCEPAYNAALAYYLREGHRLYVLGDVDELWECTPEEVANAYPRTVELERQFHDAGRYIRFFGNHDDHWRSKRAVKRQLAKLFPGIRVLEALHLDVVDGGKPLGELFLAHGHQGTADYRFRFFVHPILHYIWRPLQRMLNIASTTPSTDWQLREQHETAMFEWAQSRPERLVLIAGHTHRPIFWENLPQIDNAERIAQLRAQLEGEHDPSTIRDLEAEIEYLVGDEHRRSGLAQPRPFPVPCYFNTGCCSFGDGDVTGIEIFEGEIRLVRWPDQKGGAQPYVAQQLSLAEVLQAVTAPA